MWIIRLIVFGLIVFFLAKITKDVIQFVLRMRQERKSSATQSARLVRCHICTAYIPQENKGAHTCKG
jgi:hypothetical protein